jgi:hypothetical protein
MMNLMNRIDRIVPVSPWHQQHMKKLYPMIPNEKVQPISNGINDYPEEWIKSSVHLTCKDKIRNSFIWTSNPNRGLQHCINYLILYKKLSVAKQYTAQDAPVTLTIVREMKEFSQELVNVIEANRDWITVKGHMSHAATLREMAKADIWFYPTDFNETDCMSAKEAQLAGCITIATQRAGLMYSVGKDRGFLISTTEESPEYSKPYGRQVIQILLKVIHDLSVAERELIRTRAYEWAKTQIWPEKIKEWIALFHCIQNEQENKGTMTTCLTVQPRRFRIKVFANWTLDDSKLFKQFGKMMSYYDAERQRGFWSNTLEWTASVDDADFFVVINFMPHGTDFSPPVERTIYMTMESHDNREWFDQQWQKLSEHLDYAFFARSNRNNLEWTMPKSYQYLLNQPLPIKTHTLPNMSPITIAHANPNCPIQKRPQALVVALISADRRLEGHQIRYKFLQFLNDKKFPYLDLYGKNHEPGTLEHLYRGPLPDDNEHKCELYNQYPYALVLEAAIRHDNYFTEKNEGKLRGTLDFVMSAPNLGMYFDPESFIELDPNDFEKSYQLMMTAIQNGFYEKRKHAIDRARRQYLNELQMWPTIERLIQQQLQRPSFQDFPNIYTEIINLDRRPDRWQASLKYINDMVGPPPLSV